MKPRKSKSRVVKKSDNDTRRFNAACAVLRMTKSGNNVTLSSVTDSMKKMLRAN